MVKPCSVCTHPKRDNIEKCLVNGDSYRDVEKIYGISKSALHRHKTEHLTLYSPVVAENPDVIARSDDLLGQLKDLITRTLAALDRAEATGDDRMFLLAVREARSNTELMMKAQAYLADRAAKAEDQAPRSIIFKTVTAGAMGRCRVVEARVEALVRAVNELQAAGFETNWDRMTVQERRDIVEVCWNVQPDKDDETVDTSKATVMLPDDGRNPRQWRDAPVVTRYEDASINHDLSTESVQNKGDNTVEAPAPLKSDTKGLNREGLSDKSDTTPQSKELLHHIPADVLQTSKPLPPGPWGVQQ